MTVHPSAKLLFPFYAVSVVAAIGVAYYNSRLETREYWWYLIPAIILVWVGISHLKRMLIRLHLEDYRVRFESGLISKTTRMMELRKVQDIRVNQSLIQRLISTGDLSIETAGESGRLMMLNIDNPQAVADAILEASHKHYKADQTPPSPTETGPQTT